MEANSPPAAATWVRQLPSAQGPLRSEAVRTGSTAAENSGREQRERAAGERKGPFDPHFHRSKDPRAWSLGESNP
jgi:hypothetical protein